MEFIKKYIRKLIPRKIMFLRSVIQNKHFKDYLVQRKQFNKDKELNVSYFPYYLSIVAVVKNEVPYIVEWIEYHLLVGVQKFIIYDNESTDNLRECLEPYIKNDIVEYIFFPGIRQQLNSYNDAIRRYRYSSFWFAFIDIDEFLLPVTNETISDFLKNFEDMPGIEVNQIIYGSSENTKKTNNLVMERFKDHSNYDLFNNRAVKTIANSRYISFMKTVHVAEYFNGEYSVDSDKNKTYIPSLQRTPLHNKIRINHYCIKSLEEFYEKSNRGRAATPGKLNMDYFYERDRNEIKDDIIMDKYIANIKNKINL